MSHKRKTPRKSKAVRHLAAVKLGGIIAGSVLIGAAIALTYVYAHPITVEGKTACMFTLPDSFNIPNSL
jgi:hypothetical protein